MSIIDFGLRAESHKYIEIAAFCSEISYFTVDYVSLTVVEIFNQTQELETQTNLFLSIWVWNSREICRKLPKSNYS